MIGLPTMVKEIAVDLGLLVLTTIVQGIFMSFGIRFLEWRTARFGVLRKNIFKAVLVSSFTAWMFLRNHTFDF